MMMNSQRIQFIFLTGLVQKDLETLTDNNQGFVFSDYKFEPTASASQQKQLYLFSGSTICNNTSLHARFQTWCERVELESRTCRASGELRSLKQECLEFSQT
jgi:ABC-type lipoprotein export system ATPase subunit